MQKQLVLTGREVEEYEAWHRDFSYFRNKCWRLEEEIDEYKKREEREKPMRKIFKNGFRHCPKCDYVVDNKVPSQNYCDRCGQRLWKEGATHART